MSEVQTVAAAVHEITHATLHNYEQARLAAAQGDETAEPPKPKDRHTEEVEAESVSFSVCQYYGIQTGENSFGYIATCSTLARTDDFLCSTFLAAYWLLALSFLSCDGRRLILYFIFLPFLFRIIAQSRASAPRYPLSP